MALFPGVAFASSSAVLGDCASVPGNCRTEGCESNERSVPNSCSGDGETCCVYFCPGTCLSEAAGCTYPRERVSGVCANKGEVCCSLSGTSTTGAGGGSAGSSPTGGSWAATELAKSTAAASITATDESGAAADRSAASGLGERVSESLGIVPLSTPDAASGATCPSGYRVLAGVCFPTGTGLSEKPVTDIVTNFANWLLAIFGFIAILGFVISGIQYLTSAGDEGQAETAKRNMKYSIIGIVVALSGWVVVQFVDSLLKAAL